MDGGGRYLKKKILSPYFIEKKCIDSLDVGSDPAVLNHGTNFGKLFCLNTDCSCPKCKIIWFLFSCEKNNSGSFKSSSTPMTNETYLSLFRKYLMNNVFIEI